MSGTAEATVFKFCTHVGYVKSQHKNNKLPLKGAWSRDPFFTSTVLAMRGY